MPKTASNNRAEWQSEILRFTVFPVAAAAKIDDAWWSSITGEKSESKTIQPNVLVESGPVQGGKYRVTLSCTPGRIDWLLSGNIAKEKAEEAVYPLAGNFTSAMEYFSTLVTKWLPQLPDANRLALGAVMVCPVKTAAEGYGLFQPFLPSLKLDPVGSSDFSYSINRPRRSSLSIAGLRINRLSKWAVVHIQRIQFSAMVGVAVAPVQQVDVKGAILVARLETDLSTTWESTDALPRGKLGAIWEELAKCNAEISQKGDIP